MKRIYWVGVVVLLIFVGMLSAQSGGPWTTQGSLSADCMMAARFIGWLEKSYTVKMYLEPNGSVATGKQELKRIVPVLKLALKACAEKKKK